jgi:hypothetical protein
LFSFGLFSGVWNLTANVSEQSVCSIFIGDWQLNSIHRRTTQNKTYDVQNTAKVWNQECLNELTKTKKGVSYSTQSSTHFLDPGSSTTENRGFGLSRATFDWFKPDPHWYHIDNSAQNRIRSCEAGIKVSPWTNIGEAEVGKPVCLCRLLCISFVLR